MVNYTFKILRCEHHKILNIMHKRVNLKVSLNLEAAIQRCSVKKVFLKLCKIHRKTPVPEAYNFIKKEILAQMFSCEFCEIFNRTFFYKTPSVPFVPFRITT